MSLTSGNAHAIDHRCPGWCALDHAGTEVALLHESATNALPLWHRRDLRVPESVEVRVVQYVPDEAGEEDGPVPPAPGEAPGGGPSVEMAHHVGGRYRVINLSPHEARRLAQMLLSCAAHATDRTP